MDSHPEALKIDKVHVWRGDRHVLRGVTLSASANELVHISGPNGTGKTTLLRVVTGLLRPEQGTVTWKGRSIAHFGSDYQRAMAYAAHEPALKADLTALENLTFAVGLKRRTRADELLSALDMTGVVACAHLPARVLSAGQRRRVSLARVLAMRAQLWLLDEPYANLDTAGSDLVSRLLQDHVSAGGLALVVAHRDLTLECSVRRLELDS